MIRILFTVRCCYSCHSRENRWNVYLVNRTFGNWTQSNPVELNLWIEFDWVGQSNEIEHRTLCEFDFRTNWTQSTKSNPIELNPLDCVRLSSATELNRTQSNGIHLNKGHVMWSDCPLGYFCLQERSQVLPRRAIFSLLVFFVLKHNNNLLECLYLKLF